MEVDEDRAETRALELDTEAGLWTARERFYIGDTEHMACVTSDRRGGKQGQKVLQNMKFLFYDRLCTWLSMRI